MSQILGNLSALTWQMAAMWAIGGVMIYLAICKEMEPTLLLPMGFGCILCNLPNSGAVEVLETLFQAGVANELFPLLLFIGIGAMIDFGPLLADPKLLLFGAAAQFGIFFTLSLACLFGFDVKDAASIAIIGAADGPTAIFVANTLGSKYLGAIMVAAYYGFVALVLALAFYLDTRRAFAFKNKPSEICLANEKHRWAVYYALVVALLAGYIMQSGGFGSSGFGMYAGF